MIYKIAHRGNTKGRSNRENHPETITEAAKNNFVEVDVWYEDNRFWLGHDKPEYEITVDFLKNDKFFCHAKNIHALHKMLENEIHCFWHHDDDVVLTSRGFVWKYPEVYKNGSLWGVCSDWL